MAIVLPRRRLFPGYQRQSLRFADIFENMRVPQIIVIDIHQVIDIDFFGIGVDHLDVPLRRSCLHLPLPREDKSHAIVGEVLERTHDRVAPVVVAANRPSVRPIHPHRAFLLVQQIEHARGITAPHQLAYFLGIGTRLGIMDMIQQIDQELLFVGAHYPFLIDGRPHLGAGSQQSHRQHQGKCTPTFAPSPSHASMVYRIVT